MRTLPWQMPPTPSGLGLPLHDRPRTSSLNALEIVPFSRQTRFQTGHKLPVCEEHPEAEAVKVVPGEALEEVLRDVVVARQEVDRAVGALEHGDLGHREAQALTS